ncbi:E3 SUMO-protein ligase SIZ1-like isoform X3 [Panicum virgatum]|uniref:E3 SUMO-protein ligase SIZ1-like isoform X3 n=1 Tax=Panicum virgatum TaxID=38727 RepID=UPI0019D5FC69|nr:E3 SUMO-protein ligase SIZ1-like isoform X3 [Panicum virgatum]XP_039799072.1 E3 SUMO-protein ligase SIZ1-like isoform X3 [Panicum virgatum]
MADLASTCKDKLAYFRIKELKDILNELGLPKQGKKQDLVDRVLALLSDEQGQRHHGWGRKNVLTREAVAKVVDDTYSRKMQVQCAPDLASRSHSGSDFSQFRPKEEATDYYHVETKVRCLCSSTMLNDNMIKCEDAKCQVWQHMTCVLIPDKPTEGFNPEVPPHFYCELCRLSRADPFWVTTGNPLPAVKFMSSGVGNDGTSVSQSVEKTFQLSRADRETVQRPEYELQVWCILINDKVQFRMQWPQYAELQVNGIPVRVVTRPGSQLLGINGRDDGPLVTTCSREGINKISLSRVDTRTFCFGVRIVRRRTVAQVLNMIPKEGEGESFVDALARVRRCLGGGGATDNADSDSDLEVVTESVTVNLRCPNSGSRMRIAGRFKPCVHMGCFDLETFVELNQRSRKWQCPICLKNYSLENLVIDPYFNRITSLLRNCSEDVNELDVKPDGSWRVKGDAATRELSQWHMPDGTLCDLKEDTNPGVGNLDEVKIEGTSDGHRSLKLGIKRNPNGVWQVSSKADDKKASMVGNHIQNNNGFQAPNTVPMISSPTGSYRDGEDASVNQEGGGTQFDISLNQEFDSFALNFGQTYNTEDRQQQQQHNAADVIVLSDSDEENDTIVQPPAVFDNTATDGNNFPFATSGAGSGYPERYQEDAGVGTSGLGLLSSNAGDFEINNWQMHSYPQPEQGFQFFGTDTDVANPFVASHNSFNLAPDDYSLDCNVGIEEPSAAHDISICRNSNELHGSLVDNPLALAGDDPSLQILFPSQPSTVPLQEELNERANAPNGVHPDDWRISLTLAAGGGGNEESASVDGLQSQPKLPSKESGVEHLIDAASALPSTNNDRCNGVNLNPRRIENIFSHPRQPRSVRPRLCLSLDTDSE